MEGKIFAKAAAFLFALSMLQGQQAMAVTTGLDFAGGCPVSAGNPFCGMGSNATEANVAELLGVDVSLVTQVAELTSDGTLNGLTISGMGGTSGTWAADSPITHIAFKSDGYFILGTVTADFGDWMNDTSAPGSWDISSPNCLASICGSERPYENDDFLTNGGQVADLSNARAFSVVPVPAAVWLFGSGLLGLVGIARRRRS